MRVRRLLLPAGACLAAVVLTTGTMVGTVAADPVPAPPGGGYPPVVGVGSPTTQNLLNDLCNNRIKDSSNNRICQSWDSGLGTIKTRAAGCEIPRPGGRVFSDPFDSLIANPGCVDFARTVNSLDKLDRPPGFIYVSMATDTLTYAFRGDGTVPSNLSDASLRRIYTCEPGLTFPSNPNGFRPLISFFASDDRAYFFRRFGITDTSIYATLNPCVRDKDQFGGPILSNDGRYLTHPRELILYSAAAYLTQITRAESDIHGDAILGSINGESPINNPNAFGAHPVFNVVRLADIDGVGTDNQAVRDLFVGPNSRVCTNTSAIRKFGFFTRADCGSTLIGSG